ncbi:hypothetical protein ES703_43161 [subsurface metagenome]
MEFSAVRDEFRRDKRLIIMDIGSLGGNFLDVIDYFVKLPEEWHYHYFDNGPEFISAMESGAIQGDSVVVLPTDESLQPGRIWAIAGKLNLKILALVGSRKLFVDDRDRQFYLGIQTVHR